MEVLYEDNHIIIINKAQGEIVQGDKTGDRPLCEEIKDYLKEKYNKPGNVFCGVVHRIDRPVGGIVIFAKTSKALSRLNEMLRKGEIHKTYWALVEGKMKESKGVYKNYIVSDGKLNKSFLCNKDKDGAKEAFLEYNTIAVGDRYSLLEIDLKTGRKHQIRVQLAGNGNPIKGDLKYGARRSNPNAGISLQAKKISFIHPVSKLPIDLEVPPLPDFEPLISLGHQQ